jgi:hypothetical protein
MQIINNKSLFLHICDQMEKLAKKEITVEEAKSQASLAKQANNLMRYELDRVKTQMQVKLFNLEHNTLIDLRQVEIKSFEDTTKK